MPRFTNPVGNWSHQGAYSIEMVADVGVGILRRLMAARGQIDDQIATFEGGSIRQATGGIQFAGPSGTMYHIGYNPIRCIRNGDGELIWVNRSHWDEIVGPPMLFFAQMTGNEDKRYGPMETIEDISRELQRQGWEEMTDSFPGVWQDPNDGDIQIEVIGFEIACIVDLESMLKRKEVPDQGEGS